jgi:leucyl aminopeptidase (aminopeptidase T)
MNYEEYLELFAESIDQPREEIGKAQELLIEKLDAGKQLHIINADGTHITMSIEGMTFANSLISKNIP